VDPGPEPGRPRGLFLLGLGIAIELVGTALLTWQAQDLYTVNNTITLPSFGAMLVGIGFVASGYARLLRSAGPRSAFVLAVAGAVAGALLLAAALAWQLAYGLIPSGNLDLEVFAALPLFFVGVATLTTAMGALGRSGSAADSGPDRAPSTGFSSPAIVFGRPAAVLAAGIAFLAALGAASGWLNAQAADVDSLYQFVAVEFAFGGAWLLLSGASILFGLLPDARLPGARRLGMLGGLLLLALGAATWSRTAPLVYALGEILLAGFLLAGVGLLLESRPKVAF
jgi:hypothetical protein